VSVTVRFLDKIITTRGHYDLDYRADAHKDRVAMRHLLTLIGLVLAPGIVSAQTSLLTSTQEMNRLHQDSKAYIARLEDPKRDAYQKPEEVIKALSIKEGEVIADIGAGSGYFTFRLAQAVGPKGRVYAVDINPDMIMRLNRRIRDLNVSNVATILCPPDDPLLADASVNRVFLCDTWHHIAGHAQYLALLKRMLKPGGEVIMVDFKKAKTPIGPPMEFRIDRDDLVREMETNGFQLAAEHTFLDYQYFLLFKLK
jgi:predicted methyltransferase